MITECFIHINKNVRQTKLFKSCIVTNVGKIVQSIWRRPMENHFAADQQSQGVKQSVDGVPWLVDGHDYGSSLTRHPVNMNQESPKYIKVFYCSRCYHVYDEKSFLNLCNLCEFLLKKYAVSWPRLFSIGQGGHPLKIRDPFKLGF